MRYNNIVKVNKTGGECLIGLEFVLGLYNMQHVELAEKLGIKKQNINMWVKQKQNIPKKYLPVLEELFQVNKDLLSRELTELEKLEIQKEKLKKDLQPVITKHEKRFQIDEGSNLVDIPIYDKEEINIIESDIEKEKLLIKLKEAMDIVPDNPYMDTYKLLVHLMEKSQHESILHKTIQALAHYLEILPENITTDEAQEEYEAEIFEIFDDYNY